MLSVVTQIFDSCVFFCSPGGLGIIYEHVHKLTKSLAEFPQCQRRLNYWISHIHTASTGRPTHPGWIRFRMTAFRHLPLCYLHTERKSRKRRESGGREKKMQAVTPAYFEGICMPQGHRIQYSLFATLSILNPRRSMSIQSVGRTVQPPFRCINLRPTGMIDSSRRLHSSCRGFLIVQK